MSTVTTHEAKSHLSGLIEAALSGVEVIIAQALHENLPLISADELFSRYGVKNLF